MTTIAYDGKTVAADRLMFDGQFASECTKLFKLPDGSLYAGAGRCSDTIAVRTWIECGMPEDCVPEIADDASLYLLVQKDGATLFENTLIPIPINPPYAIGSGSAMAMAAMKLGKTAKQAVECASGLDVYTGRGVDAMKVMK